MSSAHSGRLRRFFVFARDVLRHSFSSPSMTLNQSIVTCGKPSSPIVASVATSVSSRSRWDSGMSSTGAPFRTQLTEATRSPSLSRSMTRAGDTFFAFLFAARIFAR